jgi:hypothetical protein
VFCLNSVQAIPVHQCNPQECGRETKTITSRKVLDIAKLLTETKDPLGALCRDHLQVFNTLLS